MRVEVAVALYDAGLAPFVIEGRNRGWRRLLVASDPGQSFLIGRFTRDTAAYGARSTVRYYGGCRTVELELVGCPQRGLGTSGRGQTPPVGAPRCR